MRKYLLYAMFAFEVHATACAGNSAYQSPAVAVAPTHFVTQSAQLRTAASISPVAGPFWTEIGDTILTRLVTEALRENSDVRVAEARVDASRASRRLAAYDYVPTVTA